MKARAAKENIMNTRHMIVGLLLGVLGSMAVGQQANPERLSIALTDPSRPAMLKVGLIAGSIFVKAYDGKDIVVEITSNREREIPERSKDGLRLIPNTSSGLTVEEDNNEVTVSTGYRSIHENKTLTIQVPTNTSLKLSTVNEGDIEVEGVNGEIEVNNTNGSVHLKRISGSVVAHALNGDLTADFVAVTPNKSMSFSSLNGDIEVIFPPTLKATLNLKVEQGEIYTDFDVKMEKSVPKIEEEGRGKRRRVVMEKGMRGSINGGGAEILFKNFTGDIVIRKRK